MRISVNLATQPYQDVRAFALRWTLLLALLAAIAAGLVYKTVQGWRATRQDSAIIRADEDQIRSLNADISKSNNELNRPANRDVRMQSAFLNTLIARKAFSWTEAFSTLEKIMPPRIHVVSMAPQLDADNRLTLKMRVAGDSRDSALSLLRRMENTPEFQNPQLEAEAPAKQGQEEFQISAVYVPPAFGRGAAQSTANNQPSSSASAARTTAAMRQPGAAR